MRVPSIGLPLDERRIVREGYRIAEYMLRDYRDPPSVFSIIRDVFAQVRTLVTAR